MTGSIKPFDITRHLDNEAVISAYLNGAMEDPDPDAFLMALGNVAKARGMTEIAKMTGLGRESIYKALAPGAKPRYETIMRLVRALGVRMTVSPTESTA